MPHSSHNLAPYRTYSRLGIGVIFICMWFIVSLWSNPQHPVNPLIILLFLMAPCIVVPLGFRLVFKGQYRLEKLILRAEPWAAFSCAMSMAFPQEIWGVLLALPWALITFSTALLGLQRLMYQGLEAIEEVCLSFGFLFIAIGGVWLLISRMGLNPMDFGESIVFLTAVHFHFAGFASCMVLGLSGRYIMQGSQGHIVYKAAAIASLIGIPMLAMGITFSPLLEVASASTFVLGLLCWVYLSIFFIRPQMPRTSKGLLICGVMSICFSMSWAMLYAWGEYTQHIWVTIPQMGIRHGFFNVFGFALPVLIAFQLAPKESRLPHKDIPWSQIKAKGFIGPHFFKDNGLIDPSRHPQGLIDDFSDYQRPDFSPTQLSSKIRAFYEHTQDYELRVTPHWKWGFKTAGILFRKVMDAVGQMALPIKAETMADKIQSHILPIDSKKDGRLKVRAWVRVFADTQKVAYAAAYSHHTHAGQTYMNIAFPFPGCHLSSILRLDHPPDFSEAISLSSLPVKGLHGDQGVYLIFPLLSLRLPINETIYVFEKEEAPSWPCHSHEKTTLLARHQMWIFGIPCLTLYYSMFPESV